MEKTSMGTVKVQARFDNLEDSWEVERGTRRPEDARFVVVDDAVVDTGATMSMLPIRLIRQLGLKQVSTKRGRTANGTAVFDVYGTIRLTIQGESDLFTVGALPDDCPVLIGVFALGHLDFIVDPIHQKLALNPDHGGQHMIDAFLESGQRL